MMKNQHDVFGGFVLPAALIFALVLLSGCNKGQPKPPGTPDFFPCNVMVTNGGTPIQSARVLFTYAEHPKVTSSGYTNASGVAAMQSVFENYVGSGAPMGKCKVVVLKKPEVVDTKTEEEKAKMSSRETTAYAAQMAKALKDAAHEVPESLHDASTSTIEFDVQSKGNDFVIDVSQYK